jgi:hypothetical protein
MRRKPEFFGFSSQISEKSVKSSCIKGEINDAGDYRRVAVIRARVVGHRRPETRSVSNLSRIKLIPIVAGILATLMI